MQVFDMVALIVVVAVLGGVIKSWIRHRAAAEAAAADPAKGQRLLQLEERVRALEAIVTDHGYDLRKQFKDLERGP